MSLQACIRFLREGEWLNVYEKIERDLGANRGPNYDRAVRLALKNFFPSRQRLEKLLRLGRDTHYSALNLGGLGPDYGDWCVRLDCGLTMDVATAFAGDPLRLAFDKKGNQVVPDNEVLERFATYRDRGAVAAIHNRHYLEGRTDVAEGDLRAHLEQRANHIEIHIHGTVSSHHAIEIRVDKAKYGELVRRTYEYESASTTQRRALVFESVPDFKELMSLAGSKRIPVIPV